MDINIEEYLAHYGTPRHSGRYPWGSGEDGAGSGSGGFLADVAKLKKQGLSEAEVARGMGFESTTQLRATASIAKSEKKQADIAMAQRLKDKGYSNVAIGQKMGVNESSVRSLLAPGQKDKADVLETTSNMLKSQVDKKGYLDVGAGANFAANVSTTKLNTAVARLQAEGYKIHYVKVEQLGTGQNTTLKVLTKPDVPYSEVFRNRENIKQITDYSDDGGRSYFGLRPPTQLSSKRIKVRYAEEGGTDADGVIYIRPGAKDLSLGGARYAQVRIAVDGSHYLKGMAIYKDDLPPGVDAVFNTNKSSTGNKLDAMKKLKDDPDNPFGAVIKPGGQRGVHNIVNEEGDWGSWSKSLSSQMLSKQSPLLAKTQLGMTRERRERELSEIMTLTNPAVRRRLLESYADDVDSSAVHLKAAALPRQGSHVILPINSMKTNEVYAPGYKNGERVALVRYPHGGIFEIPELIVNNRHPEARKILGTSPKDAIGIHSKVAERLSGADFDGDTVLVIPNGNKKVKTAPALAGLKDFDPQRAYPGYPGMPKMNARTKQVEMGVVSNLITDMTIRGANSTELAAAVRHSMVVIDAEKHGLNYRQSAIDNGIKNLKAKYQGDAKAGASTLISRASSEIRVNERKARSAASGGAVDKATGKKMYEETGASYVDKNTGKVVARTTKSTKLAETDDANTLSSGTPVERIYADHSNTLKGLANKARREAAHTKTIPYSPSAKAAYSKEVVSLNAKLNVALRNAPLERQAQILANAVYTQKLRANPDMEHSEKKKVKGQALAEARTRTGAKKQRIEITHPEWAAIQAGAISNHKLDQILSNADLDQVKQLATPKTTVTVSPAKKQRAQQMLESGYTQSEVADALGISVSTLKTSLG